MSKTKLFFKVFWFIFICTFVAFGGGNSLMPHIEKIAVQKRKWLTKEKFDDLVITTNLIPGPSSAEVFSFIAIQMLGFWLGILVSILALLPHTIFAFVIFILFEKYIPEQYLFVLYVSVIPIFIATMIGFAFKFLKKPNSSFQFALMFLIILITIGFILFIPIPWNIPAFIMIGIILIVLILFIIKKSKKSKIIIFKPLRGDDS